MRFICYTFLFLLIISSCKKEDIVVGDNVAPPDTTIENVTYEDYVNRTYILLLGREPDSAEFLSALNILKPVKLSEAGRSIFLDSVFSQREYYDHTYNRWRVELLNDLDTAEITNMINVFNFFLADTIYQYLWPQLIFEIDRLELLRSAYPEYTNGLIEFRELQSRMLDNYFYDQINMGDVNFVLFSFQQILNRNPTAQEQKSAVAMLGGLPSLLFLKLGSNKDDYLAIFFDSNDYYEGTVIRMYRDYLFRSPNSVEMSDGAVLYRNTKDLRVVQKKIMSSDEFLND